MSEGYAKHSRPEEKKSGPVRKILKFIGAVLLIAVLLFAGLIGFLSATEYKPADSEEIAAEGEASEELAPGDEFSVMSWNIGYGALGDNADFFMDGGKSVKTADKERVMSNMDDIIEESSSLVPDIMFFQEADKDSSRSNHINEYAMLQDTFQEYCSSFANNFKVAFLPYPVPPIGKVDSGIATFSSYPVSGAERIQLPIPFSWPVRMANLKRCVLISRVPLKGTDKELVLVNLHLEAYDDGEGKKAQTAMLAEIMQAEKEKGNYVIAGGDFNQTFSSADISSYVVKPDNWQAGLLDESEFAEGWQFMMNEKVPSCRSLIEPYADADKDDFQYYLIDGFIVSDNIKVTSVENQNLGFTASDHNPVYMKLQLVK
ncbi:MAG: endonuclease/exonuclease/phosphatase family protein [Mogibacterium sp.]|nr:endonuclease/exonuclease/phosphatase family protein [Mogibacterium sp.]